MRFAKIEWVLLALSGVMVALFAFRPAFSTDLFWHLQLGQIIAETGSIPTTDLFNAVHPDSSWVQFQWLWELLAYGLVNNGGLTALRATQAAIVAGAFLALYVVIRRRTGSAWVAAFISALALVAFEDRFRLRPDVFNLVLWVAALPWLWPDREDPDAAFRWPGLAALAALSFLWANLHGGGVLILHLSLGAIATGALVERLRPVGPTVRFPLAARALGVAVVASLLSPAFLSGLAHFASIFGAVVDTGNEEWLPSWTILRYGWHPNYLLVAGLPVLATAAFVWHGWRRPKELGWSARILGLGYLFLGFAFVRAVYLVALPLAWAAGAWAASQPSLARRALAIAVPLLAAVPLHYNILHARGDVATWLEMTEYDLEPTAYPELAAQFLAEAHLEGGVLNEGKWAGYLLWHAWPEIRVFADSRHHITEEMWSAFRQMHSLASRPGALDAAAERWGLHLAVFEGPTFPLELPPPGWVLVYKAGPEEVYLRRGGPESDRNRDRAIGWLTKNGAPLNTAPTDAELQRAATEVGSRQFLAHPWQKRRLARAAALREAVEPMERAQALVIVGRMAHEAGLHAGATESLSAAIDAGWAKPKTRLALALSAWLSGSTDRARVEVNALRRLPDGELGPIGAYRLAMLERALGR